MGSVVIGVLERARLCGEAIAVRDGAVSLTYRELADRMLILAAEIDRRLDRPGPVAAFTPHDVTSAIAVLGVMASGRGVIPLDTDHPDTRNRLIAGHAGAAGVVTTSDCSSRARSLFESGARVIELDRLKRRPRVRTPAPPGPDDVAFILYTSGSTGAPKGAFQTHGPLLADLAFSVEGFGLGPGDHAAAVYPPATAAGLRALLGSLLAGATVHVLEPRALGSQALAREIRGRGITVFRSSATLFRHLAEAAGETGLPSLRLVALGGDRVDWSDYDAFRSTCGQEARFASHLGATECSIYAEWFVDEAARGDGGALPVGRANSSYRVRLLDEDGAEVGKGETGEFVVEGPRVAQGYWKDPERTAAAFGAGSEAGLRSYRTGDLGRRRPDGLFEVVGRRDQQIKLRGFRIELGEIETALRACSGIKDGAVVARRTPDGAVRSLAAYVELKPGVRKLLPRHITSMLGQRLPAHMLPASIVVLDQLPWLANFKVDRRRLETMDQANARPAPELALDPDVAAVIDAFERVLRRTGIRPEDDLLSLGGDSLQAVDIALEIELALGAPVPPEAIELACPILELAARLAPTRRAPLAEAVA
jgi:amino acid adenylation domain-containing protein